MKASNTALKEREYGQPEIIPWPYLQEDKQEAEEPKRVSLDQKFLYYKDRQIPIAQFQKSGYDKLLKLLIKEIER